MSRTAMSETTPFLPQEDFQTQTATQREQVEPTCELQQFPPQITGQLPPGCDYPQQPLQQMQYTIPAPVFQQQPTVNKPDYPSPHDFLILSIIVTTVCLLLNLTSLGFGIPATIFAILSNVANNNYNYEKASNYARTAIILTIINIVYTLAGSLIIIGTTIGAYRNQYRYY